MAFSSVQFLFIFLPLSLAVYWLLPKALRNGALGAFSLLFFAWAGLKGAAILLALAAVTWLGGLLLEKLSRKKPLLILLIAAHLAVLAAFKYAGFAARSINALVPDLLPVFAPALPLGVSFYVFTAIGYLADVSCGKVAAARSPFRFFVFLAFFGHGPSGPIVRYDQQLPCLDAKAAERQVSLDRFCYGIKRFVLGLAKKAIIADQLALIYSRVTSVPAATVPAPALVLGYLAYMMQLYFDFSGYSDMAIGIGSFFGLVVGFQVFPRVIWGAYDIMYTLPAFSAPFRVPYALISSLAAVICTLLATVGACYSTLMECPARLMLPRAPKPGKRVFLEHIPFIWKHLSFTKKVTVRNLLRYKKRFFMTVIGIAGCTGLLLTGFGLRDSIQDIISKQYEDICQYNMTASLKDGKALQEPALRAVLDDTGKVESFLPVHQENGEVTVDDTTKDVTLFVPERTADLPQFIHLQNRKTGEALAFTEDQVVLTEKLAEQLGVRAGSSITIKNADGKAASATVSGVTENYLYSYAYMSPTLYTSLYGDIPEYATVLGILTDASSQARDTLSKTLLEIDDVSSVQFTTDLSSSFADVISNIDYIVIVLIISAGLLAFVVLYNLTNINITERQKEIATIKVLGFYNREVSAYVYRETLLLSLIGTAAGLVFGIFLHAFVVKTAEVDMVMFGRTIKWTSYIFAAVLTMLFSALVNLVMYRKLKAVDMVESMKAGE